MTNLKYYCILLFCISACSNDTKESKSEIGSTFVSQQSTSLQSDLAIPNNQVVDHYQILLMGNSHVTSLGGTIKKLIKARFPTKEVTTSNAIGNYYLAERLEEQDSVDKLKNTPWTHVILQAQKYSTSGAIIYPTDAAISWIKQSKSQNTTPIMFPEHPRFNKTKEGLRVHLIHKGIAEEEAACVAPVGLAWDRAIELYPNLVLHHADGNHANVTGELLTAMVFYQVITGESADALPYVEEISVEELQQNQLGQVASYIIELNPPCLF